jgi:hypothetical protein
LIEVELSIWESRLLEKANSLKVEALIPSEVLVEIARRLNCVIKD